MNKPRFSLIFSLLVFFVVLIVIPASAADLTQWSLRNSQLWAVAEGNGIYVAVGKNGFIMRSTDSDHWEIQRSGVDADLYDIAYGNGVFTAVGGGKALVSSDGISWEVYSPSAFSATSIAFGGGTFAAVGGTNVFTSINGITWSAAIATGSSSYLSHIIYGGARFVAVGHGGTVVTTSNPNVSPWTIENSHTANHLWQVTYNGSDTYVAVGDSGTVITAGNAMDWTVQTSGVTQVFTTIGYGDGQYVVAGSNSSSNAGHIWTSPSAVGASWTEQTSNVREYLWDVLYSNADSRYIIVGGKILSSPNAVDWDIVHDATGWDIWSLAYGNGVYAAGTFNGNIIISPNGRQWTETRAPDMNYISGLAYRPTNHRFVATLSNGHLIYSDDYGSTWKTHAFTAAVNLNGLEYLHDRFIGFGTNGGTIVSPDGETWYNVSTASSINFQAVAYGNGLFVAIGSGTTVYTSLYGTAWTPHATPATSGFNGVAYGNGRFVAVGYDGNVITSLNGIDWTLGGSAGGGIYSVRFYDGQFLATCNYTGQIYASTDGVDWNAIQMPCSNGLFAIGVDGPTLLAGGPGGTILQLDPTSSFAAAGGGGGGGCFIAAATNNAIPKGPGFLMIILAGFIAIRTRKLYK